MRVMYIEAETENMVVKEVDQIQVVKVERDNDHFYYFDNIVLSPYYCDISDDNLLDNMKSRLMNALAYGHANLGICYVDEQPTTN